MSMLTVDGSDIRSKVKLKIVHLYIVTVFIHSTFPKLFINLKVFNDILKPFLVCFIQRIKHTNTNILILLFF